MAAMFRLESFDAATDLPQGGAAPEVPEGYEEGYVAGVAAAEANTLLAQSQVKEALVEAAKTSILTHEAAQEQVVAAVAPLFEAIIATLLPAMLVPSLHAQLRELVTQALTQDADAPLMLKVAPDQVEAVSAALSDLADCHLQIAADPTLSDAAAWVIAPRGETSLDLDGALLAIRETLAAVTALNTPMTEAS